MGFGKMEISYNYREANVVRGDDVLAWKSKKAGLFLQSCRRAWCELHPELADTRSSNIVYELLFEIGAPAFRDLPGYSKSGAYRAYMLYLAYLFSEDANRLPDTETIRGLWYLRKGFKQFAIELLGDEFDIRRASQDLSATLVELVDSGDFEYYASFCVMDEGAWSEISSEKGWVNLVVCVEKDARASKLLNVCRCLGIKVIVSGGGRPKKAKSEELWYKNLAENTDASNPLYLLCVTDYDPAGQGIVANFEKHFKRYTPHVATVPVGVFPWQVAPERRNPRESLYDLNAGKGTQRRVVSGVLETKTGKKAWTPKKSRLTAEDLFFLNKAILLTTPDGEDVY